MAVHGAEILEGVGGDILNPRDGGGAYDDMLRALHDVMAVHRPTPNWNDRVMHLKDYYKHLEGVVENVDEESYADLLRLTWPRGDWQAQGGVFQMAQIYGSNPLYQLNLKMLSGEATVIDHEQQVKRWRVGQNTLLAMTHGVTRTDDENFPDDRYLSNGYVIIPKIETVDIRDAETRQVTGDSVRRALDPYEEQLAALATSLSIEAEQTTFIKPPSIEIDRVEVPITRPRSRRQEKGFRQMADEMDRLNGGW